MELREVLSSNIRKVGYEDGDLIVEYLSGTKYRYKKVPKNLYEAMLESDSKGRFMNNSIKGKFDYEKIS